KTNPFMLLERRLTKERDELLANMQKPDFWIDQETINQMQDKVVAKYEKYKARNIRLRTTGEHRSRELLTIEDLSLGYTGPLFTGISFGLGVGEHLQLRGRNGVGKSTLIKAILAQAAAEPSRSRTFAGSLELNP